MHKELRTNIEMTCLRLGEITMVDSTYISDEAIERARRAGAESLNGSLAVAARYLAVLFAIGLGVLQRMDGGRGRQASISCWL